MNVVRYVQNSSAKISCEVSREQRELSFRRQTSRNSARNVGAVTTVYCKNGDRIIRSVAPPASPLLLQECQAQKVSGHKNTARLSCDYSTHLIVFLKRRSWGAIRQMSEIELQATEYREQRRCLVFNLAIQEPVTSFPNPLHQIIRDNGAEKVSFDAIKIDRFAGRKRSVRVGNTQKLLRE